MRIPFMHGTPAESPYAWGWSVVSTIALYAGIAALIGFVIMLFATVGDFIADPKIADPKIAIA